MYFQSLIVAATHILKIAQLQHSHEGFELILNNLKVALNKESNVPGRPNLDKKKQVPLLCSTMMLNHPRISWRLMQNLLVGPGQGEL